MCVNNLMCTEFYNNLIYIHKYVIKKRSSIYNSQNFPKLQRITKIPIILNSKKNIIAKKVALSKILKSF